MMCGPGARILRNLRGAVFCPVRLAASLYAPHGLPREMAMSELRQQTIALWILLMLLILVPWALE
jgi:hypothetical protein